MMPYVGFAGNKLCTMQVGMGGHREILMVTAFLFSSLSTYPVGLGKEKLKNF